MDKDLRAAMGEGRLQISPVAQPMRSKLFKLPSGDWVDPGAVCLVQVLPALEADEYHKKAVKPRVTILGNRTIYGEMRVTVEFDTPEQAKEFANSFGAYVNSCVMVPVMLK